MKTRIPNPFLIRLRQFLPYALCNVKGSGKWIFVNRDYHLLGTPKDTILSKHLNSLHINSWEHDKGIELTDKQVDSLRRISGLDEIMSIPGYINFYLYSDANNPFVKENTSLEREEFLQSYFRRLEEVMRVISI